MRRIILGIFLTLTTICPVCADSIDDAEAKRRGVSVETIQLENAKNTIASLQAQVIVLNAKIDRLIALNPQAKYILDDPKPATQPTATQPKATVIAIPPTPAASPAVTPSGPKTVQVSGYTRKDGTYVAPYTRSAPRSK